MKNTKITTILLTAALTAGSVFGTQIASAEEYEPVDIAIGVNLVTTVPSGFVSLI